MSHCIIVWRYCQPKINAALLLNLEVLMNNYYEIQLLLVNIPGHAEATLGTFVWRLNVDLTLNYQVTYLIASSGP